MCNAKIHEDILMALYRDVGCGEIPVSRQVTLIVSVKQTSTLEQNPDVLKDASNYIRFRTEIDEHTTSALKNQTSGVLHLMVVLATNLDRMFTQRDQATHHLEVAAKLIRSSAHIIA